MNGYIKKVSNTLILGIIIFLVCVIVYLAYPKFQIISNSGNIWKLNKVTGQVTREYRPSKVPPGYGNVLISKPKVLLKDVLKNP